MSDLTILGALEDDEEILLLSALKSPPSHVVHEVFDINSQMMNVKKCSVLNVKI